MFFEFGMLEVSFEINLKNFLFFSVSWRLYPILLFWQIL